MQYYLRIQKVLNDLTASLIVSLIWLINQNKIFDFLLKVENKFRTNLTKVMRFDPKNLKQLEETFAV